MKIATLSDNWPKTITIIAITAILLWAWGCPPRVQSLITPQKKVTRPELQIELDTITATAAYRMADLDHQEQFRDIVLKNALIMVEGGTLNPIGIITGMAALYGVMSGGTQLVKRVKKKNNTNA